MKIEELQNQNLDLQEEVAKLKETLTTRDASIKNYEAQLLKSKEDYATLQNDYNESLKINTRLFSQMNQTAVHIEPEVETKPEPVDEGPSLSDLF